MVEKISQPQERSNKETVSRKDLGHLRNLVSKKFRPFATLALAVVAFNVAAETGDTGSAGGSGINKKPIPEVVVGYPEQGDEGGSEVQADKSEPIDEGSDAEAPESSWLTSVQQSLYKSNDKGWTDEKRVEHIIARFENLDISPVDQPDVAIFLSNSGFSKEVLNHLDDFFVQGVDGYGDRYYELMGVLIQKGYVQGVFDSLNPENHTGMSGEQYYNLGLLLTEEGLGGHVLGYIENFKEMNGDQYLKLGTALTQKGWGWNVLENPEFFDEMSAEEVDNLEKEIYSSFDSLESVIKAGRGSLVIDSLEKISEDLYKPLAKSMFENGHISLVLDNLGALQITGDNVLESIGIKGVFQKNLLKNLIDSKATMGQGEGLRDFIDYVLENFEVFTGIENEKDQLYIFKLMVKHGKIDILLKHRESFDTLKGVDFFAQLGLEQSQDQWLEALTSSGWGGLVLENSDLIPEDLKNSLLITMLEKGEFDLVEKKINGDASLFKEVKTSGQELSFIKNISEQKGGTLFLIKNRQKLDTLKGADFFTKIGVWESQQYKVALSLFNTGHTDLLKSNVDIFSVVGEGQLSETLKSTEEQLSQIQKQLDKINLDKTPDKGQEYNELKQSLLLKQSQQAQESKQLEELKQILNIQST